mmetsp:Transcript_5114/g.11356  ORF Transcript_5114/g.11356 Transcript_5114/m.11356 type:complete len:373 (+) Transcript_5114:829-1947(+)
MSCSRASLLSVFVSISLVHLSFLMSSSAWSFFRSSSMSSKSFMIFLNPGFDLPSDDELCCVSRNDNAAGVLEALGTVAALMMRWLAPLRSCKNEAAGLPSGSVFLKRACASSLFRILIVSAIATFSAACSLESSSYSLCLALQDFRSSLSNFRFLDKASRVSSKSSSKSTCCTLASLKRPIFVSMAAVAAAISFCFAFFKDCSAALASISSFTMVSRSACISSPICFKMPMISLVCGASLSSWRKAARASPLELFARLPSTIKPSKKLAESDCRNSVLPMPSSSFCTAFFTASMLAFCSVDSLSKSFRSCARMDFASSMASSAAERSFLWTSSSCSNWAMRALFSSMLVSSCGCRSSPSATSFSKFAPLDLQ